MPCKFFRTTENDVYLSNIAIGLIIGGVTLTMVAFVLPFEFSSKVDPTKSAQQNEAERIREANTRILVYVLSLTGLACVTFGGVISSFILTKYILLEECVKTDERTYLDPTGNQGLSDASDASSLPDVSKAAAASTSTEKAQKMSSIEEHDNGIQHHTKHGQYGSLESH